MRQSNILGQELMLFAYTRTHTQTRLYIKAKITKLLFFKFKREREEDRERSERQQKIKNGEEDQCVCYVYDIFIGGLVFDVQGSELQSPTIKAVERYQRPRSIGGGHEGEEQLEQSTSFDEELWFPVSVWTEQKRTRSLIKNYHLLFLKMLIFTLFLFLLVRSS